MRRQVKIISLGGTIAMETFERGLRPAIDAEALVGSLRQCVPEFEISTLTLAEIASPNIGYDILSQLHRHISTLADDGYAGVIVTQGTDTLEETAFAFELMPRPRLPVVFTGAMRSASAPSPDGPANIVSSLHFIASRHSAPEVVAIFNDEVHAARTLRKAHTTRLAAFTSGEYGLRGRVHETRFVPFRPPMPGLPTVGPGLDLALPPVWIVTVGIEPDDSIFAAGAEQGVAGWIIAAMGAGHVPEHLVPRLEALAGLSPVVLCTRTGEGDVCESTYAYPGSEMDLLPRGLIPGGNLSPLKARVLLSLLLADRRGAVADRFVETAQTVRTAP